MIIIIIITLIFTSSWRCTLSTSKSTCKTKKSKQKKHKYYKCIHQCQHDKKAGWKRRSTSTVNACINIKAFHTHTHSNKHKYYKIMHTAVMQPMAAAGKEGKSVTAAWSELFDREPFPMEGLLVYSTLKLQFFFFLLVQCDTCWLIFIATVKSVCFLLNG